MPPWKKVWLGPLRTVPCESCGSRLSVPFWILWIGIALSIVPIPIWMLNSWILAAALIVALLVAACLAQLWWVPLVHRAN